jgi:hypothetical protein
MSEREKHSALPVIIGGLIVTPILYVLSAGPVVWLETRDLVPYFAWDIIEWFYAPLNWLYEEGPAPIHDALDWYVDLWY